MFEERIAELRQKESELSQQHQHTLAQIDALNKSIEQLALLHASVVGAREELERHQAPQYVDGGKAG